MPKNQIRLTPLVRMTMTFNVELKLDKKGVFGLEAYEKYIERHSEATEKQDALIKSLYTLNAILFLVLNGQDWTLPIIGAEISSIPAILEILMFAASLTFYFTCAAFVTTQCYEGIVDQYGKRIVDTDMIDPDFFNASRKHYHFFLKLYRPKLNFWGVDFYQHGRGFAVYSWIMNFMVVVVTLIIPLVHLVLIFTAAWHVFNVDWNTYAKWFLLGTTALINIGGLALVIGMLSNFTFNIIEPVASEAVLENDS